MSTCPIRVTINEIKGGNSNYDEINVPVIFGAGGEQRVCDEVNYYYNTRKIARARAQINGTTFPMGTTKTFGEFYVETIETVLPTKDLYKKFADIINAIATLEQKIRLTKHTTNITLPTLRFTPHADKLILFRPELLATSINKLISYFKTLRINSILTSTPPLFDVTPMNIAKIVLPPSTTKFSLEPDTRFAEENEIIQQLVEVENQQAIACNKLDQMHTYVAQLIDGF